MIRSKLDPRWPVLQPHGQPKALRIPYSVSQLQAEHFCTANTSEEKWNFIHICKSSFTAASRLVFHETTGKACVHDTKCFLLPFPPLSPMKKASSAHSVGGALKKQFWEMLYSSQRETPQTHLYVFL